MAVRLCHSRSLTWLATAKTCVSGTSAMIVTWGERQAAPRSIYLSQNHDGHGEIRAITPADVDSARTGSSISTFNWMGSVRGVVWYLIRFGIITFIILLSAVACALAAWFFSSSKSLKRQKHLFMPESCSLFLCSSHLLLVANLRCVSL